MDVRAHLTTAGVPPSTAAGSVALAGPTPDCRGALMAWTWRYEDGDGTQVDPEPVPRGGGFPTQSDAETWLGENWRELRSAGVGSVTLLDGDHEVYGGMSLSDPQ
jgi:hypothetical protein